MSTFPACQGVRTGAGARAALVLAVVAPLLCLPASAGGGESSILVMPIERAPGGKALIFTVRVDAMQEVAGVTLWAIARGDALYRAVPMKPVRGGHYEARLPITEKSPWQAYYVEATGQAGRIWSNGSVDSPFVVRLDELARRGIGSGSRHSPIWPILLVGLPLAFLVGRIFLRPGSRAQDDRFWAELLAPLSRLQGDALRLGIQALCAEPILHPSRGAMTIPPERALAHLNRMQRRRPELLAAAERRQAAKARRQPADHDLEGQPPERIEEDLFWFRLLGPLVDQGSAYRERTLRELASRVHTHPVEGRRMFGVPQLREQLDRVSRMRPSALVAEAEALRPRMSDRAADVAADPDRARRSSGMSMVELLVVLALVAVGTAIGALYLKPLEAPVQVGGETLMALVEQTRSKAISTTRVHRVRPIAPDELIVESGASCSAFAWTYDPKIDLQLPDQVTMDATNWTICFDRRGVSSQSLVLVLSHPDRTSRSLELLRGGAMRWAP